MSRCMKNEKDTWRRQVRAGSRQHWCSSLRRAGPHCSTAPWWHTPQSPPRWNPPATGTRGSSATLKGEREDSSLFRCLFDKFLNPGKTCNKEKLTAYIFKIVHQTKNLKVCVCLSTCVNDSLQTHNGILPNVSTSVMHLVSSCRSMSLGIVSGLLSMWPLYFLGERKTD